MRGSKILGIAMALAATVVLCACATTPPPEKAAEAPAPAPVTSYERSWQAARAAAYDEGVRITSEDRSSGTLLGDKGPDNVRITVAPLANGAVRVEFSVTGPEGSDLHQRLTNAYNRRMGR